MLSKPSELGCAFCIGYNRDVPACYFVSDIHGQVTRYQKLFDYVLQSPPQAVFLGGDLLPAWFSSLGGNTTTEEFVLGFLASGFENIRSKLGADYPRVFVIPGNDDRATAIEYLKMGEGLGLWEYIHQRRVLLGAFSVYGYACVPPTPFLLKDWERYDVSRYVDPGCVPLDEGWRTVPVDQVAVNTGTIQADIDAMTADDDMSAAIFLFHAPPYQTKLDRAALDGKFVDHVPLDVHVGSIAIRRFIEARQPLLTLHGHIHESSRLTGAWRDCIGRTHLFSAAYDGEQLAIVCFDLYDLANARRVLL